MNEKTYYTLDQAGKLLTETVGDTTMPADYSFETVNDFVHGIGVNFEELQCLCLGMASEIDRLREAQMIEIEWVQVVQNLIRDDALAVSFQTMGQYRTMLLKVIRGLLLPEQKEQGQ